MIFKTLLLVLTTGLAFVVNQATAQYAHHHQQFFDLQPEPRYFDTKALTPVKQDFGLEWAFASTFAGGSNPDVPFAHSMLVKLKENMPLTSPFFFEWAKEYYDPSGTTHVDVEDVYFSFDTSKYILCGKVWRQPQTTVGFLLEVDFNGNIVIGKFYKKVSAFTSVVPTHKIGGGYVAVGKTQPQTDDPDLPPTEDAVYVEVDSLLEVVCAQYMGGVFFHNPAPGGSNGVASVWNKVIQYQKDDTPAYAVVGDTSFNPGGFCRTDEDILVAMVYEQCQVKWVKQYGSQLSPSSKILEHALSVAQFSDEEGGLVITGNTTSSNCGNGPNAFEDILVVRLDHDGHEVWLNHYNVDFVNQQQDTRDVGTAVQMPRIRAGSNRNPIMIAGETETQLFPEATGAPTWDAFLMEIDWNEGDAYEIDVFGLYDGIDNGALSPGKLDLHLSRDTNNDDQAVLMGNAKINPLVETSRPYLIERYHTVTETCKDTRREIDRKTYDAEVADVIYKRYGVKADKMLLEQREIAVYNKYVCDKKDPDPTPEPTPTPQPTRDINRPTGTPSEVPTRTLPPSPTPFPTISFEPSRTGDPDPTPRPTPVPTPNPTPEPTGTPTLTPTCPTPRPTPVPTPNPTPDPTPVPTPEPTPRPTRIRPTPEPTPRPTPGTPTSEPTDRPTPEPTPKPTPRPTPDPTPIPTPRPSCDDKTPEPTPLPTPRPTPEPTPRPTRRTRQPIGISGFPIGIAPIGVSPIETPRPIGIAPIGVWPIDEKAADNDQKYDGVLGAETYTAEAVDTAAQWAALDEVAKKNAEALHTQSAEAVTAAKTKTLRGKKGKKKNKD